MTRMAFVTLLPFPSFARTSCARCRSPLWRPRVNVAAIRMTTGDGSVDNGDTYSGSSDKWASSSNSEDTQPVDVESSGVETTAREMTTDELKRELLFLAIGCNRGFAASPEKRERFLELVGQLERKNPTEEPVSEPAQLVGTWSLLFTNALDVLSLGLLAPVVSLGEIFQNIEATEDAEVFDVANVVELEPAVAPVANSFLGQTKAVLKVAARGEKATSTRMNITFKEGAFRQETVIGFPLPSNVFPALKVPLKSPTGYIETTFLDEEIRIARAPPMPNRAENVFVLKRDSL